MKVEPAALDLLETARAVLAGEIVAALPEAQRYPALMAANALAIAARDIALGSAAPDELARIVALLGEGPPAGETAQALREATARLASRVRVGRFDREPARAALLSHLRATTASRLAVSNPKALKR